MPTYDYLCENCGHEFEKFQSISASVLRKCPKCGKMKLKRLIGTGAGVIFRGSGFYQTDYRSDSYTQAEKKEKAPAETKKKSENKAGDKETSTVKKKESSKPDKKS